MRLPRRHKERKFFSSNLLILVGMIIVAYQLFTYAKKVYQDYQIDLQIAQYQQDIEDLKVENDQMHQTIDYLHTDAYREKVAKGVSGLKNPGEEVYIVKGQNPASDQVTGKQTKEGASYQLTNMQKWWNYFFGTRTYVTH